MKRDLRALMPIQILMLASAASPVFATPALITLRATRTVLLADGKQQTIITADVRDSNGRPLNGVDVQFQTTAGTLTQTHVEAVLGTARTQLVSASVPGVAHVTAVVTGITGGASVPLDIEFTDDPDATFQGNNYLTATGPDYLAYSATDHMIEAQGAKGVARIVYRNFEVTADRIQFGCDDTALCRASGNVVMKRGKDVIHAYKLYYSLSTGQGYAIAELDGKLQHVSITGEHLTLKPTVGLIPASYLTMPDQQVKLLVVAKGITYVPGDKLQFRHAKFFQDQVQLFAMPLYEMKLNSNELFSDHFLSVGSQGLGLSVPWYYNMTPNTVGTLTLSHDQQLGRGYATVNPGWRIDMLQTYSHPGGLKSDGSFGFTGLTNSDWGFQWNHNLEFSASTQGSFFFDLPNHNSLYTSANLINQTKQMRYGLNLQGGETFTGQSQTTLRADVTADTVPRGVFGSKSIMYVLGSHTATGEYYTTAQAVASSSATGAVSTALPATTNALNGANSLVPNTGIIAHPEYDTSQEVTIRTYMRPVAINKETALSTSLTLGQLWSHESGTGFEGLATISLDHSFKSGGLLNLTYDLVHRPSAVQGQFISDGQHRISLSYNIAASKQIQVSLFGSTYLDTSETSLIADAAYRLSREWRLLTAVTEQNSGGASYRDLQLTLGRRIGSRELQLSYSTYNHRWFIDFTSTHW